VVARLDLHWLKRRAKTDADCQKEEGMSTVRLLVGTRKGAFVLTSDAKRARWDISGPYFGGWEIYHLKGSPADPHRLYASQSSGWFGQQIQRSNDGGQTWESVGNTFVYAGLPDTHQWYDGSPHPNVLFVQKHWDIMRSDDAGESWHEVSGNLPTDFGFPIAVHAHEPDTIYVVPITSDSEHYPPEGKLRVYRSRTGGNEWEALTQGLPQRDCYLNVLRDAMAVDTLDLGGLYFGTTGGQVYSSADAGDSWASSV
jgi:photosystem II stability/assembly factor-like uncharacterized protein